MLLLCCAMAVNAVPAKRGWQTIAQSDGTTLTVRAVGNAFNHAILTSDGLTVARGADGDFYYISSLTGLTTVRAHDKGHRTASEEAFVNVERSNLSFKTRITKPKWQGTTFNVGGSNAESGVPALGQRKIPIILVEFKDKKFNITREQIISAMLTGNSSVGQYFRDQSNGLYQPDFEVYGIYTLSQNREYYGGHSGDDNDKGLGYMVTEACQKASAQGVSFKPYDTDNDDYCDVVIVIYAGVGEAQSWWTHPEAIWPCNWNLSSASYYGQGGNGAFRPANGDPYVDTFAVFNELNGSDDNATTIDGIGTFAHEFGHCLGLPDFYDTGSHPEGEEDFHGMGSWDIMCNGCYNNNGYTPTGYTAYEKVFMGWIDYITPQPGTYYTLPAMNQKSAATDKALCLKSPLNDDEYFIIENRRKQGWDRYNPGQGIMISHVTFNAERWWYNTPNNENIQLMTVMNADNSWSYADEGTDLWPQGDKTAFTDNSTPAAKLNMSANGSINGNAGYLGQPVTEMVINEDGTASFWYMKDAATSPVVFVSSSAVDLGDVMVNHSGTATFRVVSQALTGDVTLTLNDANGVFSINPTVISAGDADNMVVTVTFEPSAITDYQATVTLSSPGAADVIVNLTGRGQMETYAPVLLPADSRFIDQTRFRADWTDQTSTANVASYTLEVKPKPTIELLETADFSGLPDALDGGDLVDISGDYSDYLPQGWTCLPSVYLYGGALIAGNGGGISSPTYNLAGYDKVTVVMEICSYYYDYYGEATGQVLTSMGSQPLTLGADFETLTIVLDCAASDKITIQGGNRFMYLRSVQIYAGDLTEAQPGFSLRNDDPDYRLIPGITGKFFTVKDLSPEGTYIYRVKAIYNNGTESAWSNRQEVTLFAHGYVPGDLDHSGRVTMDDLSLLINYLLTDDASSLCPMCADMDGSGNVSMDDLSMMINYLLTH